MDQTDLIIILGALSVPTGLLVAVTITGWGYRRSLARSMAKTAAGGESFVESAPIELPNLKTQLEVRQLRPTEVAAGFGATEQDAAVARRLTRKVRAAYIAACITYGLIANTLFLLAEGTSQFALDVGITIVFFLIFPEVLLVFWLWRYSLKTRLTALAGYAFVGLVLALFLAARSRIKLLPILYVDAVYPSAGALVLLFKRIQPLLIALVAVLLYELVGLSILLWWDPPWEWADVISWALMLGFVNLVGGVIIFGWMLRRRRVVIPVLVLAGMTALGLLADRAFGWQRLIGVALYGLPANVLQVSFVWLIFKGAVWLQDRKLLSAPVLHAHVCWGWLTLILITFAVYSTPFFGNAPWLPWSLCAAFLCYVLAFHGLLWRLRSAHANMSGKRLLLLRVFGTPHKREWLLDSLDDTWRRIGQVDLITGTDIALRGLASTALEAFLLRRLDDQFLKTPDDVHARLKRLRSDLQGDVRFPLNSLNCYGTAWRTAVTRLASTADAILLDLRGFSRIHQGCTFELTYLIHHTDLRRAVLLVDSTTDMGSLTDVAHSAWASMPFDSPNAEEQKPELTALKVEAASDTAMDSLFLLLLRAAHPSRSCESVAQKIDHAN